MRYISQSMKSGNLMLIAATALAPALVPVLALANAASGAEGPQSCRGSCWVTSKRGARIIVAEQEPSGGRRWRVSYAGGILERSSQVTLHYSCADGEWRDLGMMSRSANYAERETVVDCGPDAVLKLTFVNAEGQWDNNAEGDETPGSYDVLLE
jgi:hypothetical protein